MRECILTTKQRVKRPILVEVEVRRLTWVSSARA